MFVSDNTKGYNYFHFVKILSPALDSTRDIDTLKLIIVLALTLQRN
jgi:hypothetical protein